MPEIPEKQIKTLKKLIETAESNLVSARELLLGLIGGDDTVSPQSSDLATGKVIEGTFDGQNMIGSDGKSYPVPVNYASKSKLVQHDGLKLTIGDDNALIYKQIHPVNRRKLIGTLHLREGNFYVEAGGHDYRVLSASVTYYKAQPGQQVAIVIADDLDAEWAAIESPL